MSETPFMPLWVSDFLGDTLELDSAEIGAYLLLLMAQWNRGGNSLPNDEQKLRRVARCGRNWPKVWASVSPFFTEDKDGIYSKRLRFEAQNVAAKRDVNKRNGALGGRAKALKSNNAGLANGTNSPERNASIPEPEPDSNEDTNVSSLPAVPKRKPPEKARLPDDWVPSAEDRKHAYSKNLTDDEIEELAYDFQIYWSEREGKDARKTERGWGGAWRNNVNRQLATIIRNRNVVGLPYARGSGQGGGIADAAARRRGGY